MTSSVTISEVGPRDGLQSVDAVMPTAAKKAWIKAEAEAGVSEIEVGSFVPPSLLPQMADTGDIVAYAKTLPGLDVVALIPNLKGAERAIAAGVDKMSIPFSMSETHSIKNVRKDHPAMLAEIKAIADLVAAQPEGQRPHFEVGLSTAFGCTIEGPVSEDQVARLAEAAMAAGVAEVGLSDTTGYANPAQVTRMVRQIKGVIGSDKLNTLHLHNTRGLGLANVMAGLAEGITTFDASLGGLGGCPFAPGASGNIVTEDLVFMLEAMGIETGINLDKLLKVREIIAEALPGEPLYGFTPDAGLPLGFAKAAA
ncbi:hydroxymethylglutaryl-CoA lyase [Parasphingorhabdus cellanae]|uniref:Hydroxymethylglutaryl-CoA lyase n=1 Tax=Parasphingorhabdus cellanae TaxID=2806553 RepID=A0ABX7T4E5_9SPHN|nr:hydroxymethylglutaryl-CoA lyase [Parasphingorhabdus cellanae]QTD55125.1 hydroxymethylglutaryl-CoA lyase [Parasphingorhabdus cellanae]